MQIALVALIVDDHDDAVRLFVEDVAMLLGRDFECVCETDPDAVVATAERCHPDAVLLDLDFEGVMLGFDILSALRAACPDLPVFLWSEAKEEDVWQKGRELGAAGLLRKTPSPREILDKLAQG